jgi:hypothetical protein
MDFAKVGAGFYKLSDAIQPFLNKVREAEASLVALDGILRRTGGKKIQSLISGTSASRGGRGGIFGFARAGVSIYLLRRIGKEVANIVQEGSNYVETLNLWQVAMRGNLDVAEQFINKMQKAYGISSKTLMNAQAIFKNMIGSLGQISDQTAYRLSEALVQMSADFSSLYNVQLKSAFEKMQAMLAGQVRPIRSAGLDMTETTLYQYYQALGGTKSMRQLNRTEKQLLSILAVFKQMGSAGALGDMSKTLNQFANQARMMTEYWAELKAWTGLLLKDWFDQNQILVHINAGLIFMTEIVKSMAKSKGLGEDNFIDGLFETTEATNEEVDELQGKLLDFDKFRSLEGTGENVLGIDEKLLEAIAGYSSKIDDAKNASQDLAKSWLEALGFIYDAESGIWNFGGAANTEFGKIEAFLKTIKDTVPSIEDVISYITPFAEPVSDIVDSLSTMLVNFLTFSSPIGSQLLTIIHPALISILEAVGSVLRFVSNLAGLLNEMPSEALLPILYTFETISKVVQTIAEFIERIFVWDWDGFGSNLSNIWSNWASKGFSLSVPNYASGASNIDSGTVFRAGEFGKTEAVYTSANGKTNVANVRQMEQAFFNALSRHGNTDGGKIVVQVLLDGEQIYENTTQKAKQYGNVWSKA